MPVQGPDLGKRGLGGSGLQGCRGRWTDS